MSWHVAFLFLTLAGASTRAGTSELSPKEIVEARKIYVAKCAKCHKFYEPRAYPEQEWRRWMESMSRKSKLTPAKEDLLEKYLDAYRAGVFPSQR